MYLRLDHHETLAGREDFLGLGHGILDGLDHLSWRDGNAGIGEELTGLVLVNLHGSSQSVDRCSARIAGMGDESRDCTRSRPHLPSRIPTLTTSVADGAEATFRIDQTLDPVRVRNVDDSDVRFPIACGAIDLEIADAHDPLPEALGNSDVPHVLVQDLRSASHDDALLVDGAAGGDAETVPPVAEDEDPQKPYAAGGKARRVRSTRPSGGRRPT